MYGQKLVALWSFLCERQTLKSYWQYFWIVLYCLQGRLVLQMPWYRPMGSSRLEWQASWGTWIAGRMSSCEASPWSLAPSPCYIPPHQVPYSDLPVAHFIGKYVCQPHGVPVVCLRLNQQLQILCKSNSKVRYIWRELMNNINSIWA